MIGFAKLTANLSRKRMIAQHQFLQEWRRSLGKLFGSRKSQLQTALFTWVASLGKILRVDNLRKHHIILVSQCRMWKGAGETQYNLLLHYAIAKELCDMVFALFGVQWMIPRRFVDFLSSWRVCFGLLVLPILGLQLRGLREVLVEREEFLFIKKLSLSTNKKKEI